MKTHERGRLGEAGRVLAGLVAMIGVALAWQLSRLGLQKLGAPRLVAALVGGGLAVALSLLVAEALSRRLDGRSLARQDLAGRGAVRRALSGGAGAVATLAIILGLQLGLGWVRITGSEPASAGVGAAVIALVSGLLVFAGVGFSEELFFRGYLLNVLSRRRALWSATVINGLLFGALHLLGGYPGAAGTALLLLGAVIFTGLMTAARELTGGLWWSMAWHGLWDWAEGDLLGLGTVGRRAFGHALLHLEQHGPPLWVGREPVIECGLLYLLPVGLLFVGVAWLGRDRIDWRRRGYSRVAPSTATAELAPRVSMVAPVASMAMDVPAQPLLARPPVSRSQ